MAIQVPVITIQIARSIGQQVIYGFKMQDEALWSVQHTTEQTTPEALKQGFDLAHDYRAMPRYVLLYFDGKDASDVTPEAITAVQVFNLSDNVESAVYTHTAWRTFMPCHNDAVDSNSTAIAVASQGLGMYNRAETSAQRNQGRLAIGNRSYKRMLQFIFNNDGSISRII